MAVVITFKRLLQNVVFRVQNKPNTHSRLIHKTQSFLSKESSSKELVVRPSMFNVAEEDRNKDTFLEAIKIYTTRTGPKRGQVEFIYSALKYMEEFGVHRDLQAYKNILDVLPKGTYIPTNLFQVEFMHYPKQQHCAIDLLEQMEDYGWYKKIFKLEYGHEPIN